MKKGEKIGSSFFVRLAVAILVSLAFFALPVGASHSTGYSYVVPKTQARSGQVDLLFEPPPTWFLENAPGATAGHSRYVVYRHRRDEEYPGDRSFREIARYAVYWEKVDGSWAWRPYEPPGTPAGVNWSPASSGTTQTLRGVGYGNGLFVAVGDSGTILTSPDGSTWTSRASGTTNPLYGVAWGGDKFVAVGGSGTILTSPDGINWTSQNSGTTQNLFGVSYGGGQFVAVGASGTILTSPDGITWTSRTAANSLDLRGVAYGGGKYVAVGGKYADFPDWYSTIQVSNDGVNWTETYSGWYMLYGVTYNGTIYVAVGRPDAFSGDATILTSPDTTSWTERLANTSQTLTAVVWGNDKFVAVGGSGAIVTSPDGVSWTLRSSGTSNPLYGVAWDGTTFVAVGGSGTILTSSAQTTPPPGNWEIVQPDAGSTRYLVLHDTDVTDWEEYYYLVTESSWAGPDPNPPSGQPAYSLYYSYFGMEDPRIYIIVSAFPPNQTRHGSYTEFTGACSGCHGLHSAASSEKLLKGPTATDLCSTCHDGSVSKYDEARGRVYLGNGRYAPAPAGPFGIQMLADAGNPSSSVHNVFRTGGPPWARIFRAPGSGFRETGTEAQVLANRGSGTDLSPVGWSNQLSCVSCHEPHNRPGNFRLLRGDIHDRGNGDRPVTALTQDASAADTVIHVYSTAGFTLEVVSWEGVVIPADEVDVGGVVRKITGIDPLNSTLTLESPLGEDKPAGTVVRAKRKPLRVRGISEVNTQGLPQGNALWPPVYAETGAIVGDAVYVSQSKMLKDSARFCSSCHRAFYSKAILEINEATVRRMIPTLDETQVRAIVNYWRNQPPLGPPVPQAESGLPPNMHGCMNCHVFYYNGVDLRTVGFDDSPNPKPIFVGQATGNFAFDLEAGASFGNVRGEGHRHPTQVPAYRVKISNKIIEGPFSSRQQQEMTDDVYQYLLQDGPVHVGVGLEGTGYKGKQWDGGMTCDWCVRDNYAQNDVVCLTCHMAHGSRAAVSEEPWFVGDRRVELAYENASLNGLLPDASCPSGYGVDYNGDGDDQDADLGEGCATRNQVSGYFQNLTLFPPGGVGTALARFDPFASVCYRCHTTKSTW